VRMADKDMVKQAMTALGVWAEFFPPNCTPVLQPLDHSINAMFKREYEQQWALWYHQTAGTKLTAPQEKLSTAVISAHYRRKEWTRRSTPNAVQLSRKRERAASNVEEREDSNRRQRT